MFAHKLINLFACIFSSKEPTRYWILHACEERIIVFSSDVEPQKRALKAYLLEHFYQHPRVLTMTRKAEWVIADLYRTYRENPALLPIRARERFDLDGQERVIADYVAGMTDRFAMDEHRKLLDPHEPV